MLRLDYFVTNTPVVSLVDRAVSTEETNQTKWGPEGVIWLLLTIQSYHAVIRRIELLENLKHMLHITNNIKELYLNIHEIFVEFRFSIHIILSLLVQNTSSLLFFGFPFSMHLLYKSIASIPFLPEEISLRELMRHRDSDTTVWE